VRPSEYKHLRLLSYYKDFVTRNLCPSNPPLRLWVDITSRCNLRCTACPQKLLTKDQRRDMDRDLLHALAQEVRGWACQVSLFHRGEALLHPDLPWWIRRFRQSGAGVRIHTNATLLNLERVAGLLWAGPEIVTCSIDSLDPAQYAAGRPGARLSRSLAGVELLLRARRDLRYELPRVNLLTMGEHHAGPGQTPRLKYLMELGLDRHIHRRPHNWGGAMDDGGYSGKPNTCTFPWYGLAVLSDGRVTPCPQDFFGRLELGRVGDRTLGEIWLGEKARALRKAHAARDLSAYPTCQACDRVHRPTLFGVPTEHLKNFIRELAGR
jgi:radical SAM protein with 4Fe4S-binding SPASM domain